MKLQAKGGKPVNITVFEYGLLSASDKPAHDSVKTISTAAFDYLKKCCLCDETESRFLKLKIALGREVLQVQNYAGVVLCPDGTQIEILPKVAKAASDATEVDSARQSLFMMLKSLKQFRHLQTEVAGIKTQKMPLLEVFIAQFLHSVNQLIKKGIRSEYVREQSNNTFLKGKLLHSQQLKHNFINQHRFFVEFDNYLTDKPANRVIHSALAIVSKYTKLNRNHKLCQELLFAFNEIPFSKDHKRDFSAITLQRGMVHYDVPLKWARLVLDGLSPQAMSGKHQAYSLLFPMEALFESFVAHYLGKNLPAATQLTAQVQGKSLVLYGDKKYFLLKPDLMLMPAGLPSIILDTKWKLLDQTKSDGKDKFGLSQADFYQMLAYGYKYLSSSGQLVLIYPKSAQFDKPLQHSFVFDEEHQLRLYVIPFDIGHRAKVRLDLTAVGLPHLNPA
ncbi:McrC family protein [Rheinheimera maricola]|uniref:McrC family protein n=1 Tax=Rheinheimera maricola TaxID=2793282 RepID=A0ABS7X688_9GAMM|nr:McrC family protein [Rheinheimera maricola]MBZ9610836.1 McrC family protein [Rheinheimera maricola]